MKKYTISLLFIVLLQQVVVAQLLNPVKWSFEQKAVGENEIELIFKGAIDSGWHLYSTNLPEGGPIATSFTFDTDSSKVQLVGKVVPVTKPIKEHDKIFDMELEYFSKEAVFSQKIKVSSRPVTIKGTIEYQTCNDETCTLNEADFSFDINGTAVVAQTQAQQRTEIPLTPGTEKTQLGVVFFL